MKKVFVLLFMLPIAAFCQPQKLLGNPLDSTKFIITDLQNYLVFKLDSEKLSTNSYYRTYKPKPKKILNLNGDSIEVSQDVLCGVKINFSSKKELSGTEIKTLPPTVKSIFIFGPAERIDKIFKEYLRPIFQLGIKFSEGGQWLKSDSIKAVWMNGDPNFEIPLKNITIEFD